MKQQKMDLRWLPTGSFTLFPLTFFPVYKLSKDKQSHSSVIEHSFFVGLFLHFTAGASLPFHLYPLICYHYLYFKCILI